MVAAIARSARKQQHADGRPARADARDRELHRARIVVLAGVAIWALLALLVQVRYGAIAAFVLVGWGGSIVLCLVFMFGPSSEHRVGRRERGTGAPPPPPAPAPVVAENVAPAPEIIDLRDDVLRSSRGEDLVPLVLDTSAGQ
jgi:hypothetical protein